MLKTVKLAHLITLSSSPVPCSCKNLSFSEGSWIFRLANGCSSFFLEREVVQLAGKPCADLTVDRLAQRTVYMRSHWRTSRNQHCKKSLESLLIGKTKLFRDENCSVLIEHEHGCRSSTSPGCDQLNPSCSPVAQNWAAVVIYLFIWNEPREE